MISISWFSTSSHLPFSDAVSHVVSVLCVLWLFSAALYHRCKGQTHQRHGVSSLLGAWHQWPRTPQQLLLHPGHPGRKQINRERNENVSPLADCYIVILSTTTIKPAITYSSVKQWTAFFCFFFAQLLFLCRAFLKWIKCLDVIVMSRTLASLC